VNKKGEKEEKEGGKGKKVANSESGE